MLRTSLRALLVFVPLVVTTAALAHDTWISRGSYKNPAGEWCCGVGDCGVVSPNSVTAIKGGYSLRGDVVYGSEATGNASDGPGWREQINEVVPYSQSLPSPDGAYWRCKRPDGTNRCFFAPKPEM
jgi:hypothetical protein